jgi:hypothetical protein
MRPLQGSARTEANQCRFHRITLPTPCQHPTALVLWSTEGYKSRQDSGICGQYRPPQPSSAYAPDLPAEGFGIDPTTHRRVRKAEEELKRLPIIVGGMGAVIALVLMFPVGCGTTEIAIPDDGPDPNTASCSTLLLRDPTWGRLEGGQPGTDAETSTLDVLWRRMASRAAGVAAVPLGAGLIAGWLLGRRTE